MTVRVTVVGCGAVAEGLYRKPLQRLQREGIIRVVSLLDAQRSHVQRLQKYFPGAIGGSDLAGSLAQTPSDLTLVLTPAQLHAAHTLVAIEHGNHVLCEKPMAMNEADCELMAAAAESSGKVLAIGMLRRFFPAAAQLKQLLACDSLGELLSFEYREGRRFEWQVTTPAAFRTRSQGGTGVLFDIGPHVVDLLQWLLGPLEIGRYEDDALRGVESNVRMSVQAGRCGGIVQMSWDTPLANELRLLGSRQQAVLKLDHFDRLAIGRPGGFQEVSCSITHHADLQPESSRRISPRSYQQAIYCQLIQTVRAIVLYEPPAVSGEEGRRCIETLCRGLRRAEPLAATWLSHKQQGAVSRLHWNSSECNHSPSSAPAASSAPAS